MSQDSPKMVSSLNIYWSPAVDEGSLYALEESNLVEKCYFSKKVILYHYLYHKKVIILYIV